MNKMQMIVVGMAGAIGLVASAQSERASTKDGRIRVTSADDLFDDDVVSEDGREIGDVEYVLIESGTGKIRSIVVESDLDRSEDQLIAIPWSALNPEVMPGEVEIQTTLDKLSKAPRTSRMEIQRLVQPTVLAQIERYWIPLEEEEAQAQKPATGQPQEPTEQEQRAETEPEQPAERGQQTADADTFLLIGERDYALLEPTTRRLSAVEGIEIRGSGGEEIGEVEELAIDVERGRIAYLLVGYGGFLGLGETYVPVPFQAIDFAGQDAARLNKSEQELTRMTDYDDDDIPRFVNVNELAQVYRQFDVEPYWTAPEEMARLPSDS